MESNVSPLFQRLELAPGLLLPNRIVMGPITRNRAVSPLSNPPYASNAFDDDKIVPVANSFMEEYYAQRARGGAGLIISEGVLVSRQGTQWENAPGLWSDLQIEGWKAVTNAVRPNAGPLC
jgi:2,4-dienoyl-CoA reductase-like NADH-dependent reductase (Old Yellow Enzyme family)